jgi:thymidylate synthase
MEDELEDKEQTIEDMIDDIGQELLAAGFAFVKRAGKGDKPTSEELDEHKEKHKYFDNLCRTYTMLKKNGRVGGEGSTVDFDTKVLQKIKEQKSSLGSIVTVIPPSKETDKET